MSKYIIRFIIISWAFTVEIDNLNNPSDCLTDELYGYFIDKEHYNLVERRKFVREKYINNLFRNEIDILSIPIVFHNYYQMQDGIPFRSFCDYVAGYNEEYNNNNNPNICYQRAKEAIEILNEQFASSFIQFVPPIDTSLVIDNHQSVNKWITSTNFNSIKGTNHIPNHLNIYITPCIGKNDSECGSIEGFTTYPEKITSDQGIAISHSYFPGINDNSIGTLAHEIGHVFTLRHLYHLPVYKNEDDKFEVDPLFNSDLVSNNDCNIRGDMICDTPGQPLNDINDAFDPNYCIYHGFGGEYDPTSDRLKIGGFSKSGDYRDDFTLNTNELANSNQDAIGEFWGTRGVPEDCYLADQEEYSTDCSKSEYDFLPIAANFLQLSGIRNKCLDKGEIGFTYYQFLNIRTSIELDYTACTIEDACNYGSSTHANISPSNLFLSGESSCRFPCETDGGCLAADLDDDEDYSQYECSESPLALNQNLIPNFFGINRIFPNPFNPNTTINYQIPINTILAISIYDIRGKHAATLTNESHTAGYHSIIWNASSLASGIYFLKMYSEKFTETQKLILIK